LDDRQKFNILIIDPDPQNCLLIQEFILTADHEGNLQFYHSSELEIAIEFYKNLRFDLIIIDPKISKRDGMSFIKTVRDFRPKTKIIALGTCSTNPCPPECQKQCMEYGASTALDKALDYDKLPGLVREMYRLLSFESDYNPSNKAVKRNLIARLESMESGTKHLQTPVFILKGH